MSGNPSSDADLAKASLAFFQQLQNANNLDKAMLVKELMNLFNIDIKIAGQDYAVLNQELLTEYSNAKTTKYVVKMATWRKSVQETYHMSDINHEQIVGYQEAQIILKMKSHRRKGSQEVVNAIRNELAGSEVIPQNTRRKKFFGLM